MKILYALSLLFAPHPAPVCVYAAPPPVQCRQEAPCPQVPGDQFGPAFEPWPHCWSQHWQAVRDAEMDRYMACWSAAYPCATYQQQQDEERAESARLSRWETN